MKLGRVERTIRGFQVINFDDHYGAPCSLQQSSLAEYVKPGTSAVWLGLDAVPLHSSTGHVMSPRMHLTRKQVKALVAHLQAWLDTGSFELRTKDRA